MKGGSILVILSGGMDSTTLLYKALRAFEKVEAISFNYGQRHSRELEVASLTCQKLDVPHKVVDLSMLREVLSGSALTDDIAVPEGHYAAENMKLTVVSNRNMIFIAIAAGYAISKKIDALGLGVHQGDHCFSKNMKFLTPKGLVCLDELKKGENIYSLNTATNKIEVDEVQEIIEKGVSEYITFVETRAGNLELTDQHEVWVLKLTDFNAGYGYHKRLEKIKVSELRVGDMMVSPAQLVAVDAAAYQFNLQEILFDIVKKYDITPVVRDNKIKLYEQADCAELSLDIDLKALVRLIGWYVAREDYYDAKFGRDRYTWVGVDGKTSSFNAAFSQSISADMDKVDSIVRDFQEAKIPVEYNFSKVLYNGNPKEITFCFSGVVAALLREFGGPSTAKELPFWFMELLLGRVELRNEFLNTLIQGERLCTTSDKLLEQVITLLQFTGYHFSVTSDPVTHTHYITISRVDKKLASAKSGDVKFTEVLQVTKVKYGEKVYDLAIKNNHNFFAGNYGSLLISNSIYPDCRPEFIELIRKILQIANWEPLTLYTPYLYDTKAGIVTDGLQLGVDYKLTHTCYNGREVACGKCGSCVERLEAFQINNIIDPIEYENE